MMTYSEEMHLANALRTTAKALRVFSSKSPMLVEDKLNELEDWLVEINNELIDMICDGKGGNTETTAEEEDMEVSKEG